jgi:hypothetical protein
LFFWLSGVGFQLLVVDCPVSLAVVDVLIPGSQVSVVGGGGLLLIVVIGCRGLVDKKRKR